MRPETNPLWQQWEFDPPVFTVEEVTRRWKTHLEVFHHGGVFQETTAAGDWWCEECTDSHEIIYQQTAGVRSGQVVCDSGIRLLHPIQTDQLKIETAALLRLLFHGSSTTVESIDGDRLWKVGRHTIVSRSRDLKFVRGIGPLRNDEIIDHLSTHSKAILFTPSSGSAAFWRSRVPCCVIALEEVVASFNLPDAVDWNAVEDLYVAHHASDEPVKSRKKRGTRTAKIERLRDELKCHLTSAADHAIATAEGEGYAALLPRPTKTQLAKLAGMSKYDVTRCFADPTASELRLLWETADDLNAILRLPRKSFR